MSTFSTITYRIFSLLRHRLTANNTLGHGIHSPFLYDLVRHVMYDSNRYYCFQTIERERQQLLRDNHIIEVEDYGTAPSGPRRVCDVVSRSAEKSRVHQLIFKIANHIHARQVVELGTNVGIGTAYLASVASKAQVFSFEGSNELIKIAEDVWKRLGLRNIEVISGDINLTLPAFVEKQRESKQTLDLAFIDANHTYDATVNYFSGLASLAHSRTIIIVDDIHYNKEMYRAWKAIRDIDGVSATFDCYHIGIVFFDKQFEKREYRLRI